MHVQASVSPTGKGVNWAPHASSPPLPADTDRTHAAVLALPVALLVALAGLGAAVLVLVAPGLPGSLLTWPVAITIWQLSVTPFCRATGFYRYHSPMFKATFRTSRTYEVHGGTSWDWLVLFRFRDRGAPAARQVMIWYLEGLIDLASRIERGEIPRGIEITGTSYFFRAETARRLGFEIRPAGFRLRFNLFLNALDLWLTYSFTRGHLALPGLLDAKQAVIRGDELVRRKGQMSRLRETLDRRP